MTQIMSFAYSIQSLHLKCAVFVCLAFLAWPVAGADERPNIEWTADYHAGLDQAENRHAQALLWFYDPSREEENERLQAEIFGQPEITRLIFERFVAIKLSRDVKIMSGGDEITLLNHPAFAEMHHTAGLAIVDMAEPNGPLYREVVSVYPFTHGSISAEKLAVLLSLPRGTLTQRTLIFAVQTHVESPASAAGEYSPILAHEAEDHARHQARIAIQGHHNWNTRFHSINARLPSGLLAQEVCAQSWPGQNLLEAAVECVHSWRQSPGHWSAVSSRQALFSYDMQRGANGVWYAAGIFASRAE